MRPLALTVGAAVLLVAGCAAQDTAGDGHAPAPLLDPRGPRNPEGPPEVVVRGDGASLTVAPYTYCWGTVCADGLPPEPLPDIGTHPELVVEFPVERWRGEATFQRADDRCARLQTVELERVSATTHRLTPAGFAGTYDVDLGVHGRGGDAFVRFRWTTPSDGPLPTPDAILMVLAEHDGRIDSYGLSLEVTNLRATPREATARVTVTAANGRSLTFTPTPVDLAPEGCASLEGSLSWRHPGDEVREAAELGEPPFTYAVDLVLDGVTHRGSAAWPDDALPDVEPYVRLTFDPPLPALSPADG
jgi:hypothetical protein